MKAKFSLSSIIITLLIIACTKPPDYPNEPVIGFIGISKNMMQQGERGDEDSLLVVLSFTDGDGNLGNSDSTLNVFFTDKRTDFLEQKFKIPFIPEQGASNGISGEMFIAIGTSCCIDFIEPIKTCQPMSKTDTLIYQIYIKDRSDNKSNIIETPPIFLQCN